MTQARASQTVVSTIVEKQLGIPGNYQYQALHSHNYLQKNWHANKLFVLGQLLDWYHPKTVLDLGTGSGNFELTYHRQIKHITGVDYHDNALAFLSEQLKNNRINNVNLVLRNVLDLPDQPIPGQFDLVLMIDILEHLDASRTNKLLVYLKTKLSKNGKLVIVTPNYGGLWPLLERYVLDRFTKLPQLEHAQHITPFTIDGLNHTMAKHGFCSTKQLTFNTFSYLLPTKTLSTLACQLELKLTLPFGNLIADVFELS